ncbi:MAG: SGNH/GDSL hydrolase family protein [Bacteroidota bacterium]
MKWQLLCMALLPFLFCCKKDKGHSADKAVLTFSNVVILGNSITYAPANPSIGWNGNWGMAASKPELDYVHILESHFKVNNPKVVLSVKNIQPFEVDAAHYDFDAELKSLRDSHPDLVIIRIGENVSADVDLAMFEKRYAALINYFKADNPNVIVLSGGSIWGSVIDNVMAKHPPFILLKSIVNEGANFSTGLFADAGVAAHPTDKGMQNIASLIWDYIKTLK